MVVSFGEECQLDSGVVIAYLFSAKEQKVIHHWKDNYFSSYNDAFNFWENWDQPINDCVDIMKYRRLNGDFSRHTLSIAIWCEDAFDLPYMEIVVDKEHERG